MKYRLTFTCTDCDWTCEGVHVGYAPIAFFITGFHPDHPDHDIWLEIEEVHSGS